MGEVYLARFTGVAGFEKRCVIKKILPALAQNKTFVDKFLNEGKTLVALTHSNIVQIFDMGCEEGEYYLAMEHIEGQDLRFLLHQMNMRHVQIRLEVACYIIMEVLKGLDYAHRATTANGKPLGIIHRDISPSNLLISSEGEVKIIDFGIAKNETRNHESTASMVQGKFAYMSPEQARGDTLDARTDLFSLGIVFYELLTGIRPFDGSSDLQCIERVKTQEAAAISNYRHDVPDEINQIVAKALAKDREKRFESADSFYEALENFMIHAGKSVRARDVIAELAPFMKPEDAVMVKSSQDFLDDAFQEMLNAQPLDDQGNRTRSMCLTQSFSQELPKAEIADFAAGPTLSKSTPKVSLALEDTLPQPNLENRAPSGMTPSVRDAFEKNKIEVDDLAFVNDDNLVEITHRRHIKKIKNRILFILLGIIIACLGFVLLTQYGTRLFLQNSFETLPNSENLQAVEPVKEQTSLDESEKNKRSQPILFNITAKHNENVIKDAVITINEGVYRSIQDHEFQVFSDQNIYYEIKSEQYESCQFTVSFVSFENHSIPQIASYTHCLPVLSGLTDDFKSANIDVTLTLLPPQKVETSELSQSPIDTNAQANEPKTKLAKSNTQNAKSGQKSVDRNKTKSAAPIEDEVRLTINTDTNELVNGAVIRLDGQELSTPHSSLTHVSSVAVITPIPKKKNFIPIPKKLTILKEHNGQTINVDFCEAEIGIGEFIVPGDTYSTSVADIYVDGTRYVRSTNMLSASVLLLLSCEPHEVSAKFDANGNQLSASTKLTPTKSRPAKTTLTPR